METPHILIVEDSEVTLFKLKSILVQLGFTVTANADPLNALDWIYKSEVKPDLIISDVNMPGLDGFEFVRRIRAFPATAMKPIIMLTSQTDVQDKITGLQAGADDYLSKTVTATEINLRIKALLTRSQSVEEEFSHSAAKTISVFSLRGGVGTTSIAVNLSIALAQLWSLEVSLLDMSLNGGHCATLLNLHPPQSLAMLHEWKENTVEDKTLESLFVRHGSGVKLLTATKSASEAELISEGTIDLIWPYIQGNSNFLILDAGSRFSEPVIPILERSDVILLVLAPDIASVKSASDALQIFEKLGFPQERTILVLNDIFPSPRLPLQKIRPVLKNLPTVEIPYDSYVFVHAILTGKPFITTSPKAESSMAIISLAYQLSSKEMKSQKIETAASSQLSLRKNKQG